MNPDHVVGHVTATGGIIASVLGWLPPMMAVIASLFTAAWYGTLLIEKLLQLYDRYRKQK